MTRRFLRSLWPLLSPSAHRRIRWGTAGAALVAILDAVGITLVFPLARLMVSLGEDSLPQELEGLGEVTGISDPGDLALVLAVATVTCFVLKGMLALQLLRSTLRTALDAEAEMAARLLAGYLRAPLVFHLGRNSSELQRTIQESTRRVYQEALVTAVPAMGDQLILVAVAILLLVIAPLEAVVGACFMVGLVAVYRRLSAQRASASSDELLIQSQRSIQYVQQALETVREIRIAGREDYFVDELLTVRERVAARQRTLTLTELLPRYYLEMGVVLGAGLVGAVTFWHRPGAEAVAVLTLFLAAALRLLPSLNRTLVAETKARVAEPHLARIVADLAELEDESSGPGDDGADAFPLNERFAALELDNVRIQYRGRSESALDGVSSTVRRGERVVLVGRSGSGKTTALNAILGLIDPDAGRVLVNGVDVRERRRTWHRQLAYVPQDVVILDTSLLANIALGVAPEDVDRRKVEAVLAATQLTEVVRDLPGGIEGTVGEHGSQLSGGQRQRLGLARALYQTPDVLVLDEATSSLDTATEAHILDILDGLGPSITIIAVAHRQQAIERFDKMIVFERGRVVAAGDLDEVLEKRPDLPGLFSPTGASVAVGEDPPTP